MTLINTSIYLRKKQDKDDLASKSPKSQISQLLRPEQNVLASTLVLFMMIASVFPVSAAGVIDIYPGQNIQNIVSATPSGSTIYLHAGTYPGFNVTTSGLTISGAAGETAIISGQLALSGLTSGTVSNLTIQDALTTYQAGLSVSKSSGITISNNIIHGNSFGILLDHITNSTVTSNNIFDNASGLEVHYDGSGIVINSNTIHDNNRALDAGRGQGGVNFYYTTGPVTFADNILTNNLGVGVEIYAASGVTIERNTFTGGSDQIETGTDTNKTACANLTIRRNIVYKTTGGAEQRGFILRCASNSLVANNTLNGLDKFAFDFNGGSYAGSIDNLRVVNNVVVNGRPYSIDFVLPANVVIDYNDVWTTSSSTALYGSQIAYVFGHGSTSSWSTFRSWTGYEAHGLNVDPQLVNAGAHDYHLQTTSPVIDRGTNVGEAFNGLSPDMGRYESGATAATATALPATATVVPAIPTSTPTRTPAQLPTATPVIGTSIAITSQVVSSSDDAEEVVSSGSMDLTSTDLELGADNGTNQWIGIRFNTITLPRNATIINAYIEFEVDETGSDATSVMIQGQASDNAATFTTTARNISSRPRTTAQVAWNNIPAWTTVNAKWQTPNISSVIQEIVNRTAWASGNSIVIIINGTGRRTAESYNGEIPAAPKLVIQYTTGATPIPGPSSTSMPAPSATPIPASTATPLPAPSATPTTASSGSMVVVAVGDIHGEGADSQAVDLLNMVDSINPAAILGLGDFQYTSGTCANFTTSGRYDTDWGLQNYRIYPTFGPTHDYAGTTTGSRADLYFSGDCAGQRNPQSAAAALLGGTIGPMQPYSFDVGSWHIISLPSLCYRYGCDANAITTWLTNDLKTHTNTCTIAYFHEAYWTSTTSGHTPVLSMKPWVQLLYDNGVELLLQGHNHDYERFYPQNMSNQRDDAKGITSFVVGTGGIGFYTFSNTAPNSAARTDNTYGLLKLTLNSGSYNWQFVPTSGGTFTDSGSAICH
jgi:parallel beta-helix repeat protein